MLPTCGQSGYITPAILGAPNAVFGSATLSAGTKPRDGYVEAKWRQSGSITPAVLGVSNPQRGAKNQKWLRGPHVGKVATAPLLSWGSPTLSWGPQRLARGQNLETATWVTCGQSGSITPAVLGVSYAQREDKNKKWRCGSHGGKVATSPLSSCGSPMLSAGSSPPSFGVPNAQRGDKYWKWLRGPHVGKVVTSPLPSWGSPTLNARTKIRNGYVAHMWAKWLHHPCYLGSPQRCLGVRNAWRGDKTSKRLRG